MKYRTLVLIVFYSMILMALGCMHRDKLKPIDSQQLLGRVADENLCNSLAQKDSLEKVIISRFVDEGIKKITIYDKHELESIQQCLFVATRNVFIPHQNITAGEAPFYKIDIYLKNYKISVWLFSRGYSSCAYAISGKMFHCKELVHAVSRIMKKYECKSIPSEVLKYIEKNWP